jgi:hypothetical protein
MASSSDGQAHLAQRGEAVLDLTGLPGDATHRARLAALELGLDQAAEISGDGRALRQSQAAECGPGLVGDRDPGDVIFALHAK